MTFTKGRLEQILNFAEGSNPNESMSLRANEVELLARIALASLEAEPVADVVAWSSPNEERTCDIRLRRHDIKPGMLYTAPPAPVSVPDDVTGPLEYAYKELTPAFMRNHIDVFERYGIYPDGSAGIQAMRIALDGMERRAALLQGKAEPVSQRPALTVWYGSMPETNGKANWTAILHRKGECLSTGITIERSEYPERVRYEADRVRHIIGELKEQPNILAYDADAHSGYEKPVRQRDEFPLDYLQGHKDGLEWEALIAEANHPQTGDWLYDDPLELAKAIRKGPDMPVEPVQGWIPCSERMPSSQEWVIVFAKWANQQVLCWDGVANRWTDFEDQSYFHDMFSHWMPLPAAPQQETKSALAAGMVRYGDAMQKLADGGD